MTVFQNNYGFAEGRRYCRMTMQHNNIIACWNNQMTQCKAFIHFGGNHPSYPSALMTLSCTENYLVIVLIKKYSETTENVSKSNGEMSNSHNNRQLTTQKPSS